MARTILEIAKEACERDNTAPPPVTLFAEGGSKDRIARILRTALKDTMRDIMRRTKVMGLSELNSTWILVTEPGKYAYPMPPDYLRMIENTENRGGWPMGLIGPASPQSWEAWVSGVAASVAPMGWRIRNNAIWLDPTPTAAEIVSIEYVSSYPVLSVIRTGDVDANIPPNTISPIVPRDGYMDNATSETVYEAGDNEFAYEIEPGFDAALWSKELSEILKRINPLTNVLPEMQVRRPEFTTDADYPAFNDDHVLSLGLTMRLRRSLALNYASHMDEYEAEIEARIAGDAGGARAFRIGRTQDECDVLPLGNGQWMVG